VEEKKEAHAQSGSDDENAEQQRASAGHAQHDAQAVSSGGHEEEPPVKKHRTDKPAAAQESNHRESVSAVVVPSKADAAAKKDNADKLAAAQKSNHRESALDKAVLSEAVAPAKKQPADKPSLGQKSGKDKKRGQSEAQASDRKTKEEERRTESDAREAVQRKRIRLLLEDLQTRVQFSGSPLQGPLNFTSAHPMLDADTEALFVQKLCFRSPDCMPPSQSVSQQQIVMRMEKLDELSRAGLPTRCIVGFYLQWMKEHPPPIRQGARSAFPGGFHSYVNRLYPRLKKAVILSHIKWYKMCCLMDGLVYLGARCWTEVVELMEGNLLEEEIRKWTGKPAPKSKAHEGSDEANADAAAAHRKAQKESKRAAREASPMEYLFSDSDSDNDNEIAGEAQEGSKHAGKKAAKPMMEHLFSDSDNDSEVAGEAQERSQHAGKKAAKPMMENLFSDSDSDSEVASKPGHTDHPTLTEDVFLPSTSPAAATTSARQEDSEAVPMDEGEHDDPAARPDAEAPAVGMKHKIKKRRNPKRGASAMKASRASKSK